MSATTMERPTHRLNETSTEGSWLGIEAEFGLLTSDDAASVMGTRTFKKSKSRMLFSRKDRSLAYPGFQFTADGSLHPSVPAVTAFAAENGVEMAVLVRWLCSSSEILNGFRPVDLLGELDIVMAALSKRFVALDFSHLS